jgi:TetR/AcrR family transcriptional repressor of nem operon
MKVTREKAAENRERILDTAARLFREKGFDGIGLADLMRSAGLTHGGFYGHFASKDDLAAKACGKALAASRRNWERLADEAGADAFAALVDNYLAEAHRDQPGTGCVLSALGSDAARQSEAVRQAATDGFKGLIEVLETAAPGNTGADRHEAALGALAQMVGALVLSRLADDEALSGDILAAARKQLTRRAQS